MLSKIILSHRNCLKDNKTARINGSSLNDYCLGNIIEESTDIEKCVLRRCELDIAIWIRSFKMLFYGNEEVEN